MERNFFRRVEIAFPVREQTHRERILRDLNFYLADNMQAWTLGRDGRYTRCERERRADTRSRRQRCWRATRRAARQSSCPDAAYFAVNTRNRKPDALQVFDLELQVGDGERMIVEPVRRKPHLQRIGARRQLDLRQRDAAAPSMQQHRQPQQQSHRGRAFVPGRREIVRLFDRRLAPVAAHHDGQQLLFFARKPGHVRIRQ